MTCAGAGLPSRRTQRLRPPALASGADARPASAPGPIAARDPSRTRAAPPQGGEHLRRRPEAERGVGHPEHVLPVGVDDGHVGGHPRTELEVRVVHVDHRVVRHDVLLRLRRVADLPNRSAEALVGEGVHHEGGLHPRLELAHVGLGHGRVHLHLLEVAGEGEDGRGRQRRGHRLPDVHAPGDDRAVDGREDLGVGEVHLALGQLRAGLGQLSARRDHRGLGRLQRGLRGVEIGLGDEVAGAEGLVALVGPARSEDVGLGLLQLAIGGEHVGLRLGEVGLEERGIDLRDELALLHRRVVVGVELGDAPADLTADLDGDHRRDDPGGGHPRDHRALRHRRGLVLQRRRAAQDAPGRQSGARQDHERGKPEPAAASGGGRVGFGHEPASYTRSPQTLSRPSRPLTSSASASPHGTRGGRACRWRAPPPGPARAPAASGWWGPSPRSSE